MRIENCPAAYERFIIEGVRKLVAEANRDADMRSDEDERIRKWAPVPGRLLDRRRTGTLAIVVGSVEMSAQLELEPAAEKAS